MPLRQPVQHEPPAHWPPEHEVPLAALLITQLPVAQLATLHAWEVEQGAQLAPPVPHWLLEVPV